MKLQLNNGVYYGEVVNGKMHGLGKILFNNDSIYVGYLQNNKYSGYGFLILADDQYYSGGWLNGMKHGKGLLKKNEFTYAGDFENGKISGSGCMKLKDGTIIIGNWKDGLLFGDNSFYYPNNKYVRKYFNQPGSDISIFASNDHFDKEIVNNKCLEIKDQIQNDHHEAIQTVKNFLMMPTGKSYVDLIARFRNAFNAKNYQKAIELLEQAEKRAFNTEDKNYCKLYTFLCNAGIAYKENRLYITLNQLNLAKRLYSQESCNIIIATQKEIDKEIKNLENRIHLEDMIKKLEQGCEYYNNNQVEKALGIFKEVKRRARNQEILNQANEKIKLCEDFIEESKRIDEENKRIDEINSYLEKAYELEEQEHYKEAIFNYKLAKELSNNDNFIESCNKNIKACEDAIEEAKERERELELEREREKREEEARYYYESAMIDFNHGFYYQAKDLFNTAYYLSNDEEFKSECSYMASRCIQLDEPDNEQYDEP